MNTHPVRHQRAFTLLELMLAGAMTALFGLLLLSVLFGVLTSWQTSEARMDSYREARASLKLLTREIATAIPQVEGMDRANGLQIVTNSPSSLRFLSRISVAAQPGHAPSLSNICGVDYFVAPPAHDPSGPTALYRRLIPSDVMFDRLQVGGDLFPDASNSDSDHAELVANNVLEFTARFLDASLQELPRPLNADDKPTFVELRLTVIGSKQADLYFSPESTDALRQKLRTEFARSFTVRQAL